MTVESDAARKTKLAVVIKKYQVRGADERRRSDQASEFSGSGVRPFPAAKVAGKS